MKIVTISNTGSMNSEIAAPCATSPDSMPVLNPAKPSTDVAPIGPPCVSRNTMERSVKVNTMPKIRPITMIGRIIGRMIW